MYNVVVQANAPQPAGATSRTFERVAVVRTLANRKVPSAIVHAFAPTGAEVVVVERHGQVDGALGTSDLDAIEAAARAAMTLRHPNVASVRDVWRESGEVCVASEFVEGETLEELRRLGTGGKELTLEVGVRVVVNLLAALSALHTLGAGTLAHGEITASNVIVGFDGLTRLVRPYRGRVAGKVAEADWFSYAAPEVIRGGPASVHADLYAVGVILWETLSRRKLFPKATREGRAARSLPVGKPSPPADANWAAPLAAVAERALANNPAARYTSAAEMAAAVRLAVRSKLAMPPRVAAAVDKLAGERIIARRNTNALPEALSSRTSGRPSRPSVPPEAVRALSAMRPSSRPPTPGTPFVVPAMPKAAPVPTAFAATPPPAPTAPVKPRPPVPPIKIADPTPKPPPVAVAPPPPVIEEAPISIDPSFMSEGVESAPEPAVAAAAPVAPPIAPIQAPPTHAPVVAEPEAFAAAGVPPTNKRVPIIAGAALLLLIVAFVIVRVATSGTSTSTAPSAKASSAHPSSTALATNTVTAPMPSPTETVPPPPSASASAEPETSAAPDNTAPIPDTSHRPHTRPRPTYDPMGI